MVAKQLQKIPPTPYDDKDYTAFPDLKPPVAKERKIVKDGVTHIERYYEGEVPLPKLPALADDAPPLRKVQHARALAGFAYLYRVKSLEAVVGRSSDFKQNVAVAVETYRAAAELEDAPSKRIAWYEARVRALKEIEAATSNRVGNGTAPPQELDLVRFERLGAEAELLKLKDQAARPQPKPEVEPLPAAPTVFVPPDCVTAPRLFRRR